MLPGNDSDSEKKDDLHCGSLVPIPLPPEVLAQEKEIESMFQQLMSDARDLSDGGEEQEERANAGWVYVVLLCLLFALAFWQLYKTSH